MSDKFGSKTPFAEPYWYDESKPSPFYNDSHKKFRKRMRDFVDNDIIPYVEEWETANSIPKSVFVKAAKVGLLPAIAGWPENVAGIPPRPQNFDTFFSFIAYDELCRCASGGTVWGITGGLGIGLPPIVHAGTPNMMRNIVGPALRGDKRVALAVSEPTAGSDVANLKTTAIKSGNVFVVNGLKKWITCGMFADFFTTAVQTDPGSGFRGIQLLVIERTRKGVSTRQMDCMGVKGSGTAYVEFDNVHVPTENLLPGGAALLIGNFSMERIGIAVQANRFARVCVQYSLEHTSKRSAFKGKLLDLPIVKAKIIEMARRVETTHAYLEQLTYRASLSQQKKEDMFSQLLSLSAEASMVKVQATKCFEECARHAAHLQGGNAYVKGNRIEHLYRQVLSLAIPGGAEDVMIDYAARLSFQGKL